MIITKQVELDSRGHFHVTNVTEEVRSFVTSTGVQQGQVLVFYRHTTGAVIIGEHEPGSSPTSRRCSNGLLRSLTSTFII
jgi:thiamine phosphate synthase YjbQ (UPF0047 family)